MNTRSKEQYEQYENRGPKTWGPSKGQWARWIKAAQKGTRPVSPAGMTTEWLISGKA